MGKKIFKCDIKECDKVLSTKFSLKRHILKHLNKKPYRCPHCGKGFSLPQYLEEHEFTHTGQKPYVCGIGGCQESFRQRGKLSIHRKQYHPNFSNVRVVQNPIFNNNDDNNFYLIQGQNNFNDEFDEYGELEEMKEPQQDDFEIQKQDGEANKEKIQQIRAWMKIYNKIKNENNDLSNCSKEIQQNFQNMLNKLEKEKRKNQQIEQDIIKQINSDSKIDSNQDFVRQSKNDFHVTNKKLLLEGGSDNSGSLNLDNICTIKKKIKYRKYKKHKKSQHRDRQAQLNFNQDSLQEFSFSQNQVDNSEEE